MNIEKCKLNNLMNQYQLICLVSPDLSEEDLKIILEKISNLFKNGGAVLEEIKSPIKKFLGYPIKNKKEAFLVNISFSANPGDVKEIKGKIEEEQQILRHIVLARKPISLGQKIRIRKRLKETPAIKKIEKPKEKKVELKEIEKKLEEILEE